jgi:hypothetical protein
MLADPTRENATPANDAKSATLRVHYQSVG